jgi:uncharacterized protein
MSATPGSPDAGAGIVDSHVHLLPERLGAKVRAFFEMGGPVPFAYPLDHGQVAEQVAAEGITTVWTLPSAH